MCRVSASHLRRGGSDTLVRKCHCLFIDLPPPPHLYTSLIHFVEGREGREAFMGILNKSGPNMLEFGITFQISLNLPVQR